MSFRSISHVHINNMICQTEGIVLKTSDFRETSRVATFFTRDYGKVKGVMKGIRTDPKKFGSNVDKFSVNDIVYYRYRNSDLHLISQCDLRNYFFGIRQDLKKSFATSYMLELVDLIMPVEEGNPEVYELMLDFLSSLEESTALNKLVHLFQIKILLLSGFRPHIDACLKCQRKISGKVKFSTQLGGLICAQCRANDPTATFISQGVVASLIHIEKNSWKNNLRLALSASVQNELKYILNNFLVFHLGRKIKSARYLS